MDEAERSCGSGDRYALAVHAPDAHDVAVLVDGSATATALCRDVGGAWVGDVPVGSRYVVLVDGHRLVLDPRATEVWFPDGHSRTAHRPGGVPDRTTFPRAVARPWPASRPQRHTGRPLVVYEAHVRGLTCRRDRPFAGTFRGLIDELPRLSGLGISVLELLPIHQYDPDEGNYWGYMPMVFGAVHRQYASGDDPAGELADLVTAAHDHDIEVWIDVVVNHTSESDHAGPTYTLRALDDRRYYATHDDGTYLDDTGTGNMIDVCSPASFALIMESLDRFADLGVDGVRFDLAAVLARDPDVVRAIGDWGERRGVRLVAEPWDLARYLLGPDFPDSRWMQWNGEFRDDVRGFLRGEPGMVPRLVQRLAGSADLFTSPMCSVNFVTAHDGFTLYDLVSYDRRHNDANGWGGSDGHHDNRSWNCGWEGDDGVPADVVDLRRRQMRNAMCLLLLSHGVPMFAAGDEVGRTQGGNNNAYNQDNETSWVDWDRARDFAALEAFVGDLIALRAAHPVLVDPHRWTTGMRTFGARGETDQTHESRSIAWTVDGLYVMANMWWEPVDFDVQIDGEWRMIVDTAVESGRADGSVVSGPVTVAPRSIIVCQLSLPASERSRVEAEAEAVEGP